MDVIIKLTMRLTDFNKILLETDINDLNLFVQKYLIHGTPHIFSGKDDDYFEFRNRIAKKFSIGFHNVFIVGSAKQGFSYSKNRDSFDYDSDVDVAIVNKELFERMSLIFRDYQYMLAAGTEIMTDREYKSYIRFLKWHLRGWIRPDLITTEQSKKFENGAWQTFFQSISNNKSEVGNHKVAAGVFKSYDDLETYHYHGIKNHFQSLKGKV